MKKKNVKKISGMVLVVIGILIYSIHYFSPVFVEEIPQWLSIICMIGFGICVGTGLLLIFFKKEEELDSDLKNTMDERNYNRR